LKKQRRIGGALPILELNRLKPTVFGRNEGTIPLMSSPATSRFTNLDVQNDPAAIRRSLPAFLVSGILASFLGAILPSWGYHLRADFAEVGNYFLSLNIGFLLSAAAAHALLPRRGVQFTLVLGSVLAFSGFLFLALCSPPVPTVWRLAGVLWIGISAGLLNAGVFQAIGPFYERDRAAAVNLAGASFGTGCLITALLVAGTFYAYSVASILVLFAIVPGAYAVLSARSTFPESAPHAASFSELMRDIKKPGAVLFSLLLFFQFGNEWSIAGWLPLFLIRRLGISPAESLLLLALYWASLLLGRVVSQFIMKRMSHGTLLIGSVASALLGAIVLAFTNNIFGAVMGILFVGLGFAAVYPLVVEKIGDSFPDYHPGLYNGIFSLAITGGFLAPWLLGFLADSWGIQAVMVVPMVGTCMVFALVLLIMLEAKLSGLAEVK